MIAEAAAKTTAAKTARIATLVRVVEPGGQERFGGQGRFDFERRAGRMTLELIEGERRRVRAVEGGLRGLDRLLQAASRSARRRQALDSARPPERRRCVRPRLRPALQGSQADPTQYLLWLSALGPGITKIGEEEVRGVPTSRYRAAVDLNLLEEQAPPGKEAEWAAYVQTLRDRLGLAFIPVEVWIDDEGLITALQPRVRFQHRGDDRGRDDGALRLRRSRSNVSAPPPDQVVTLNDVIRP